MSYELSAGVEGSSGRGAISGHRHHAALLRLVGSAGAVAAGGTVGLPALATAVTVAGVAVGAFGAADDRPGAGGGLAGAAFAVQLDHDVGAQGGVLLVAADPLVQLGRRPLSGREGARVEGHKHRVQAWTGRLAAALAGGGDGALADGFGVGGGHAEAVAGEGFAQRRPGGAQLGRGGVDAAELFGQGKGVLSLAPVGEEAAGLPAQVALSGRGQTRQVAWCPGPPRGARLVSELCPECLRESSDAGQVDCDLCLPFPIEHDDDQGGVLVVTSQGLLPSGRP
jgi:hypothetical protein